MTVVPLKRRRASVPRPRRGRGGPRRAAGGRSSVHWPAGPCEAASRSESTTASPTRTPNADHTGRRERIPRPYCGVPRSRGPSPQSASGTARPSGRTRPRPGPRAGTRSAPQGAKAAPLAEQRAGSRQPGEWCGGVGRRRRAPSRHLLRAVRQLLHVQPLVVRQCLRLSLQVRVGSEQRLASG